MLLYMFTCVECLVDIYFKEFDSNKSSIIDNNRYNYLINKLFESNQDCNGIKHYTNKYVEEVFKDNEKEAKIIINHIRNQNSISHTEKILKIRDNLGKGASVTYSDEELKHFWKYRNKLIHSGDIYSKEYNEIISLHDKVCNMVTDVIVKLIL